MPPTQRSQQFHAQDSPLFCFYSKRSGCFIATVKTAIVEDRDCTCELITSHADERFIKLDDFIYSPKPANEFTDLVTRQNSLVLLGTENLPHELEAMIPFVSTESDLWLPQSLCTYLPELIHNQAPLEEKEDPMSGVNKNNSKIVLQLINKFNKVIEEKKRDVELME